MAIEVQSVGITANTTHVFTFETKTSEGEPSAIDQYFVGLQKFKLSFGGTEEHHIKRMSIALATSHSGRDLQVTPIVRLSDAYNHVLSPTASEIIVVAMAWLGANDERLLLANGLRCPSTVPLPCGNPLTLQAGLAGFDMIFSDGDHHVQTVDCWIGCQASGASATVSGQAEMHDTSGHYAGVESTGNLIAIGNPDCTFEIRPTNALQGAEWKMIQFKNTYSRFQPVLSGFKVQFEESGGKKGSGEVKEISAEVSCPEPTVNGSSVTVKGEAKICDKGKESQDNTVSSVTGFVIGW